MRTSLVRTCFLLLVMSAPGCRGDIPSETDGTSLEGTAWTLDRIEQSGKAAEPLRNEIYSILLKEGGLISGQSDCNDCVGTYHFQQDGALVLSLGCTESACGPSGSSFPHFPVFASGVFDHEVDGSILVLRKRQSEGSLRLIFTAETSF